MEYDVQRHTPLKRRELVGSSKKYSKSCLEADLRKRALSAVYCGGPSHFLWTLIHLMGTLRTAFKGVAAADTADY